MVRTQEFKMQPTYLKKENYLKYNKITSCLNFFKVEFNFLFWCVCVCACVCNTQVEIYSRHKYRYHNKITPDNGIKVSFMLIRLQY